MITEKLFRYTSRERGMWRGWFEDGHVIECHWGREPIGIKIGESDNDGAEFRRQLWMGLGFFQVFIPLWRFAAEDRWDRESAEWGIRADRDSVWLRWGKWSRFLDYPWSWHTISYQKMAIGGRWVDVFRDDDITETISAPYTYKLMSGEVQERKATVSRRRHIITYVGTKWLPWPRWVKESIDVEFDGEVGERSGSWKGGTIGCGYDLRPGEAMIDALRRMESERSF